MCSDLVNVSIMYEREHKFEKRRWCVDIWIKDLDVELGIAVKSVVKICFLRGACSVTTWEGEINERCVMGTHANGVKCVGVV